MSLLDKLTALFREFPGTGPRQARRFVYFLLSKDAAFIDDLARRISGLGEAAAQCKKCFRFFERPKSETAGNRENGAPLCAFCADGNRATGELMVVAKDADLDAIEKSGTYHGRYFVLGGVMTLTDKKNSGALRLKELARRIEREVKDKALKEIILALSANPDGEHTSGELKRMLSAFPVKISALGRGLSTGSELEYADRETLASALRNRSIT